MFRSLSSAKVLGLYLLVGGTGGVVFGLHLPLVTQVWGLALKGRDIDLLVNVLMAAVRAVLR